MKINLKKIFIINICLLVVVLISLEAYAFYTYRIRCAPIVYRHAHMLKNNPDEYIKQNMPHYELPRKYDYKKIVSVLKTRFYLGSEKRAIITIGCSYTDGVGLNYNQTFAAKLNKYTRRLIYNRGLSASGPQFVYRQLSDENFTNEIPDAEYVIYTFIYDHFKRVYRTMVQMYSSDLSLRYDVKNGKLKERFRPFWFMYWSFLLKSCAEYDDKVTYDKEKENNFPLFMKIMEESALQTKKNYPDSKFVLLEVPESGLCYDNYVPGTMELNREEIKTLENMGIIYINAEELVGHKLRNPKYKVSDKEHPSELFWEEVVPKLAKKLDL